MAESSLRLKNRRQGQNHPRHRIDGRRRTLGRRAPRRPGARVLVHGRDRTRGDAVVTGIAKARGAATFLKADLASLAEVRGLAETVGARPIRSTS